MTDSVRNGPEERGRRLPDRSGAPVVPRPLVLGAAIGWRLIVAGAAFVALAWLLSQITFVVVALLVAVLLTTLLRPPAAWLMDRGWRPTPAALLVVVSGVAVIAGVVAAVVPAFISELDDLGDRLEEAVETIGDWLVTGPLSLSRAEVDELVERVLDELRGSADTIVSGVLTGALLVVEIIAGILLALVLTFFFVRDGTRMWDWFVGLFAERRRGHVREIGRRSWETLSGYVHGIVLVALFDAVGIGLALALLGVPLVLPLSVLVFFGAFVPFVGAFVAGGAAVLVALVSNGLGTAIAVALANVVVQQLEANLFQPIVVGRAVDLHPVAILLGVTTSGIVAGIIGAILAVPVIAVGVRIASYLREAAERGRDEAVEAVVVPGAESRAQAGAPP